MGGVYGYKYNLLLNYTVTMKILIDKLGTIENNCGLENKTNHNCAIIISTIGNRIPYKM